MINRFFIKFEKCKMYITFLYKKCQLELTKNNIKCKLEFSFILNK